MPSKTIKAWKRPNSLPLAAVRGFGAEIVEENSERPVDGRKGGERAEGSAPDVSVELTDEVFSKKPGGAVAKQGRFFLSAAQECKVKATLA